MVGKAVCDTGWSRWLLNCSFWFPRVLSIMWHYLPRAFWNRVHLWPDLLCPLLRLVRRVGLGLVLWFKWESPLKGLAFNIWLPVSGAVWRSYGTFKTRSPAENIRHGGGGGAVRFIASPHFQFSLCFLGADEMQSATFLLLQSCLLYHTEVSRSWNREPKSTLFLKLLPVIV